MNSLNTIFCKTLQQFKIRNTKFCIKLESSSGFKNAFHVQKERSGGFLYDLWSRGQHFRDKYFKWPWIF